MSTNPDSSDITNASEPQTALEASPALEALPTKKRGPFKWLFRAVLALVLLLTLSALGTYATAEWRLNSRYHAVVTPFELPDSEEALARGKHLVHNVMHCGHCHGDNFAGYIIADDSMFGRIVGPNITPAGVVADYTVEDWLLVLRHGLYADGRPLFFMPSHDYIYFSDDEIGAVIAYLQSVEPIENELPTRSIGPIGYMLTAFGQLPLAADKIDHTMEREQVVPGPTHAYGRVLAQTCVGCHGDTFSGGAIPGGHPEWPSASNITPHVDTGIGAWTREDFDRAMRHGETPDGRKLNQMAMPWGSPLKDYELEALWLYLQSVTPKEEGNR